MFRHFFFGVVRRFATDDEFKVNLQITGIVSYAGRKQKKKANGEHAESMSLAIKPH